MGEVVGKPEGVASQKARERAFQGGKEASNPGRAGKGQCQDQQVCPGLSTKLTGRVVVEGWAQVPDGNRARKTGRARFREAGSGGGEGATAGETRGLERAGRSEPVTDGGMEATDRRRLKDRAKG